MLQEVRNLFQPSFKSVKTCEVEIYTRQRGDQTFMVGRLQTFQKFKLSYVVRHSLKKIIAPPSFGIDIPPFHIAQSALKKLFGLDRLGTGRGWIDGEHFMGATNSIFQPVS